MDQDRKIGVTFYGVRGSTPCHGDEVARYGGNTSCVSVEVPGHDPILLDMGTGVRYFGLTLPLAATFHGSVLLTHLHWDHVQGLPFFTPILQRGARLDIYGPRQEDGRSLATVLESTICPPLFPIPLSAFPGAVECHDVDNTDFTLAAHDAHLADPVSIKARLIPHVGPTCGYRLDWEGRSIAYMSDHQMPTDGSMRADAAAAELAQGVDLLIHDSQYTVKEFAHKSTWGHCTVEYAVWLAAEVGAKRLALFHHDPTRCDEAIDYHTTLARKMGERKGVEVFAAAEGLRVSV
ncbi:MAG TPA: MBL fold metallo-hydrolase [Ilumatobacteraceae bacterium]